MGDLLIIKGVLQGFTKLGADKVNLKGDSVYLDIPNDSELMDREKLKRAAQVVNKIGYKLKVKYL